MCIRDRPSTLAPRVSWRKGRFAGWEAGLARFLLVGEAPKKSPTCEVRGVRAGGDDRWYSGTIDKVFANGK
eukprot:1123762-Prymnesium_polylepis.1